MVSILIPTYNYSIVNLVNTLQKQISKASFPFEIIVIDDNSNDELILAQNKSIDSFNNCQYIENTINLGRTANRDLLAKRAKYNWLLFMDADVLPKSNDFIKSFQLNDFDFELIFGGICYKNEKPKSNEIFRWKYGKSRESISLKQRQQKPYLSINSGCFLIKKELFLTINKEINIQKYGMDILFKQVLKKKQIRVLHIDNPVIHLGLESSQAFLKKSLEAIETTVFLEEKHNLNIDVSSLQKSYSMLKKLKMLGIFSFIIKKQKIYLEKNFNSTNPNLFFFDLYRLNYYIELKNKKSA